MSILRTLSILRAASLVAAVASASPASAAVALTLGDALLSRPFASQGEASIEAAQNYFDADALLTLGALALAGGVLAAAARIGFDAPASRLVRVRVAAAGASVVKRRDAA